ncbi:unnamed protein product [Lathyrus oleraceus]|uniref:Uncharacterized protein n=1 Tax=Pisum sativum TaxID=3888 RepID=A0A9D5A1L0_PEA|nr:transcription factor MYB13-like [Pisum sativum]KAI5389780.1 hypothetical protein KIW84_075182 [Pisum sativum]
MARTPFYDKSGMRKGTWSAEEDRKLIAYVTRYGCWNWRQLPKFAGLSRCGKSCRLRWMNYLRPDIKRGNFTQQEEELIIQMHKNMGNRWSVISAELPGRTDNEVKNHWHTSLKKRVQQMNTVSNEDTIVAKSPANSHISDITDSLSPFSSSSDVSSTSENDFGFLDTFIESMDESFWLDDLSNTPSGIVQNNTSCAIQNQENTTNDVFLVSHNHMSYESFVLDNDFSNFLNAYTESTVDSFWTHPYEGDMSYVL